MPLVDGGETVEESAGSSNTMEMAYANIMEEIIEDAILNLCFRVHRAVKMGYFPVDGYYIKEKEFELCPSPTFPSTAEKDSIEFNKVFCHVDREAKISLICPHCQKKVGANRFAPHLSHCMGNGQRISGRNASKRINLDAFVSDCDDDENISDYGSSKKRTRKKLGKNSPRRAPKLKGKSGDPCVSSMSDATPSTSNYQDMPYEQRKGYLNQMCGVISKHTRKMCMNTLKCSQHTDEQRREVRQFLLGRNDVPDQLADDVHIDVDTVDEENNNLRLWDHPVISRSPSPPEVLPCSSVIHNSRHDDRNIYAPSMSRHNQSGYF